MVSNEMVKVVGVIEWGSAREDWGPTTILAVGSDERVAEREVRREAARITWAAVENDPTDWDLSLEDLPVLDLDSAASVEAWSKAWREQTTEAWLTVEVLCPAGRPGLFR